MNAHVDVPTIAHPGADPALRHLKVSPVIAQDSLALQVENLDQSAME